MTTVRALEVPDARSDVITRVASMITQVDDKTLRFAGRKAIRLWHLGSPVVAESEVVRLDLVTEGSGWPGIARLLQVDDDRTGARVGHRYDHGEVSLVDRGARRARRHRDGDGHVARGHMKR